MTARKLLLTSLLLLAAAGPAGAADGAGTDAAMDSGEPVPEQLPAEGSDGDAGIDPDPAAATRRIEAAVRARAERLALAGEHCPGEQVPDPRWFDRAQNFFSVRACTPAIWFDRFFGDPRDGDVADALVRVIPSLQYSDHDFTEVGVRFRAQVNLPHFEQRLSLVLNEETDDPAGALPGEVARPEVANNAGRESSGALRYLASRRANSRVDFDVGLRSQLQFFARARYVHRWPIDPWLQLRYTQSLWFRGGDGFGETSLLEVERMLAEDMLLRVSTQLTLSELANGFELREGLHLLRQIDRNRAIDWGISTRINSDPVWRANQYSTSLRYRQRVFRPWLFVEVEPFLDFERVDGFNTNPGIAFRVEFWLGSNSQGGGGAPPAQPTSPPDVPTGEPAASP